MTNLDRRTAVLRRHRPQPRGRSDRLGRDRRRDRHRRDADGAAEARARERRPVPRERGPAGRVHGRHGRAPELLRVRRAARHRRRARARRRSCSARSSCPRPTRRCSSAATTTSARSPKPNGTVAYFETDPVNPTTTLTVTFDASFARANDGDTDGLKYYWDFGDGTHAVGKTGHPHVRVSDVGGREARRRQGRLETSGACTGRPSR